MWWISSVNTSVTWMCEVKTNVQLYLYSLAAPFQGLHERVKYLCYIPVLAVKPIIHRYAYAIFVKLATDKFVNPKVRHCNFNNLWIYIYSASMKSYWNIVHSIIHSCYFIVISAVIYLSEKPLKVRRRDRNSYLHSEVTVCYIVPHKRNSNIPMLKALDDPLHAKNWYKFWVYT